MAIVSRLIGVVILGCAPLLASATESSTVPATPPESAPIQTEAQQNARTLLMQMAHYVSALQSFSVTVHAGYDVVQDSGEKIEFLEQRQFSIQRPQHLRMTEPEKLSDGDEVIFDGEKITISNGAERVFSQAIQPATLDDGLIYFLRDLHMRLPLAPLFMSALPAELERRITSIDYVETTSATGVPTHQIAARLNTGVDLQIWFATGDKPLPQRIVLTYRDAPGAPQFWAQFTDWNLQPDFDAATFRFDAPDGARQIPFAVQFPVSEASQPQPAVAPSGSTQP